jgi:transposase-like protein
MLWAIVMFDGNDGIEGGYRRVEVVAGPVRRRWSAQEKARIVEETLVAGRLAPRRWSGRKGGAGADDGVGAARLRSDGQRSRSLATSSPRGARRACDR